MDKVYQYIADGYYAGEAEDYGILPNNATRTAPTLKKGFIPCWDGKKWGQVEDHKGESGYVNGVHTEIKDYGPLPEGWSTEPPEQTAREKLLAQIVELESQQTPRRLREAALTDEGRAWLQNLENQIAAKRAESVGL